jgi:hypothetical protein
MLSLPCWVVHQRSGDFPLHGLWERLLPSVIGTNGLRQLCGRALPSLNCGEELSSLPCRFLLPPRRSVHHSLPSRLRVPAELFDLFGLRSRHVLGGPRVHLLGVPRGCLLCVLGQRRGNVVRGRYVLCNRRDRMHGMHGRGLPGGLGFKFLHCVRRREFPGSYRIAKLYSVPLRTVPRYERPSGLRHLPVGLVLR